MLTFYFKHAGVTTPPPVLDLNLNHQELLVFYWAGGVGYPVGEAAFVGVQVVVAGFF